jgi:hypothetical protein
MVSDRDGFILMDFSRIDLSARAFLGLGRISPPFVKNCTLRGTIDLVEWRL